MTDRTRASDVEREHVVGLLRTAAAEGRLTVEELETRTTAAYAAMTRGELSELLADLPDAPAALTPGRQPFSARWQTASDPRLPGGVLDRVVPFFLGHGFWLVINTPHRLVLQRAVRPEGANIVDSLVSRLGAPDSVTIDIALHDQYVTHVYGVAPLDIRQRLAGLRA